MSVLKFSTEDLDDLAWRRESTVGVIGYGGPVLSLACLFANVGFYTICVDLDHGVPTALKKDAQGNWRGFSQTPQGNLAQKHLEESRLTVTTDISSTTSASDIVLVNLPPFVDSKGRTDYSRVENVCHQVGLGLRAGSLIILQGTMGPRGTKLLITETLEKASGLAAADDFGLAYSPVDNGLSTYDELFTAPRLVGAVTSQSLDAASRVLRFVTKGNIVPVRDVRIAEIAKLFEHAYMDVNVALANELARFCEKLALDFLEVRAAINNSAGYLLPVPQLLDGHGLRTPDLLIEEAEDLNLHPRLLTTARKTNAAVLDHTIRLARDALKSCEKTLRRTHVAIFGVSDRSNMKGAPSSVTKSLVDALRKKGAKVRVYDPFYSHKELARLGYPVKRTLTKTTEGTDCIIVTVSHDRFRRMNLGRLAALMKKPAAIVDMSHVIKPAHAEQKGLVYRGLGRGIWTH